MRGRRLPSLGVAQQQPAGAAGLISHVGAHHPCPGSRRGLPYSAHQGKKSMNRQTLDDLKQQIPLMGYLQRVQLLVSQP
jgi:hypothetical protein